MTQKQLNKKEERYNLEDNELIIAGKYIEVYNQKIIEKFQIHNKIKLLTTAFYLEQTKTIVNQWTTFGIEPEGGFPLKFENIEQVMDSTSSETGKIKKSVYTISISKPANMYKFTKD